MNFEESYLFMIIVDKIRKYKDFILLYLLIWALGVFFYAQTIPFSSIPETIGSLSVIAIIDTPAIFLISFFVFPRYLKTDKIVLLASFVVLINIITVLLYSLSMDLTGFSKFGRVYWEEPIKTALSGIRDNGFRESIHTVFFSSLLTVVQYLDLRKKFEDTEKGKAEAELKLLKSQIDPHFLFNNLNILSSLIKKDTDQADNFITRFSNLYRYMLSSGDKDFVSMKEEMKFLDDYVYLLNQRFGKAYQIDNHIDRKKAENYIILPAALQGLVENAVKHNEGSRNNPLLVTLNLEGDNIVIKNEIRPKMTPQNSTGTGLKNLNARYELVTNKSIQINENQGAFEIRLPLIKMLNS